MDQVMQSGAVQRLLSTYAGLNVAYKVATAILLAGLLHKMISKPRKYKHFPVWATIELAVAGFIIPSNGLARRI